MKTHHLLFLCSLLLISSLSYGQAKLEKLLKEREILHLEWQESENKKSGIFGNRTKKDMIESNTWLERILSKDNQIMEELKMLSSIESAELGQAKEDYKNIAFDCEREVQILKRNLEEQKAQVLDKTSERRPFEWASLILFFSSIFLGYWVYKLKSAQT
ncbi:Clp protease ClpB [Algoriphagus sediminis]|uniref:Clp protease ClpB n=1 Tax=Algoriphagus sediminis TaxID=3057113 RepID=A0ABT7YET8_9BACT|nr:Clp protease ClpB [Algoriphagus sediminis]MDN3205018.1 Clp protease ClpB [Algoriphagus sediminis]